MKYVPNILTSLRILAAGVFACLFMRERYAFCAVVFGVSLLTDLLDGAVARKFNCVSNLGKILDPIADKLTLLVVSICFYNVGWIPLYMLIIVIAKECVMVIGGLLMLRSNIVAYSDAFGKAATSLFSVSIAAALLKCYPAFAFLGDLYIFIFGLSIVCSIVALLHYAKTQFIRNAQ